MVYRKTRTGCLGCKARKVKVLTHRPFDVDEHLHLLQCDEAVPCTACTRRGLTCSIQARGSLVRSMKRSSSDKVLAHVMPVTRLQPIAPSPRDGLTAQDRELLYHWHNVAFRAVNPQHASQDLWQHEVTRLAFDHPVIMNLALAISSFERAHTAHRSQRDASSQRRRRDMYASLGFKYSLNAVGMMRTVVARATRDNGAVCHLASILITINSYAEGSLKELLRKDNDRPSMLDNLLIICRLTKGTRVIGDCFGVIRPERREKILYVTDQDPPDHGPLDPLLDLLDSLTFLYQEKDPQVRQTCEEALDLMKWLVRKAQRSEWCPAQRASMQWMCLVSKDFMDLLDGYEPAALVLLSYGCFLANDDADETFVMTGWRRRVRVEIRDIVGQDWAWAVAR